MRMHKAGILCAIVIFGLLLSGCSSDNEPKIPKPQGTVTFPAIAWQRPAEPISQSRPLVRLTGVMRWHQSTVNDIAFSANNTRLASIGADSTLVVWNLANGESLASQSNVDGRRVFWGPEDQTILTVTNEGFIRVWALKVGPSLTLEEQAHFAGHDSPVQTMAQSPDHSLFAVGAENGEIKLWQIPEGNTMTVIPAHNNSVVFLAFSPDGQRLVSISLNQGIMVWSVPDGQLVYPLVRGEVEENPLRPQKAVFSPDSKLLAVSNQTGIQMWNMETGELSYFVDAAQDAAVSAIMFSPDGKLVIGCGMQALIGVWETSTGDQLGLLPLPGQICANVAFSPDSTLLITLPKPGRDLFLWNILHITDDVPADQKMLERADRHTMGLFADTQLYDIRWSPDGRFIVALDELGPIYVLSAVG